MASGRTGDFGAADGEDRLPARRRAPVEQAGIADRARRQHRITQSGALQDGAEVVRVQEASAIDRIGLRHTGEVGRRSEEHTSELQSLMRHSYAVFCSKK